MSEANSAWQQLESRLAGELGTLHDGEFVVIEEPKPPTEEPRGLLRRRPKPPPTRYVQALRVKDHLHGECVGATLFGGDWEIAPGEHEQLRALGWLAPGDPDETGTQPSYPNYWHTLPRERAAELAALAVGALRVLGADPGSLTWRRET